MSVVLANNIVVCNTCISTCGEKICLPFPFAFLTMYPIGYRI